jgi:hypothetical protein
MPRIMGIGKVSKLSKKHKPKKAGSFKGLGVVLEGSAAKSKRYGGGSLRGTPTQHAAKFKELQRGVQRDLQSGSCQGAMNALFFAGRATEAARGAEDPRLLKEDARRLYVLADNAVRRNCGCKSK